MTKIAEENTKNTVEIEAKHITKSAIYLKNN